MIHNCSVDHKFLSFQSKCLEEDDYFSAGLIVAMSIIHEGPGPRFLSPFMFKAIYSDLSKVVVPVKDVYDPVLQSSLRALLKCTSPEEASQLTNEGT